MCNKLKFSTKVYVFFCYNSILVSKSVYLCTQKKFLVNENSIIENFKKIKFILQLFHVDNANVAVSFPNLNC